MGSVLEVIIFCILQVHKLRAEAANLGIPVSQVEKSDPKPPGDIPALMDYDFQGEPGGQSLEK